MEKSVNGLLDDVKYSFDDLGETILDIFTSYESGSVSDILREIVDSNVDIHHEDLLRWLGNNYGFFENYVKTDGLGDDFKLFETIMSCEFEYYSFYIGSELMLGYAYDYILNDLNVEEITKEQEERIEVLIKELDNLETFRDELKKLVKGEN
jgi:hypothetical protein